MTDKLCQYRNGCRNPIFGLTGEIYCQGCQQKDKNRTFLIGDISASEEPADELISDPHSYDQEDDE